MVTEYWYRPGRGLSMTIKRTAIFRPVSNNNVLGDKKGCILTTSIRA